MNQLNPWETAAAIATVLVVFGAFLTWITKRVQAAIRREIESQKEENRKLRADLDLRFRLPAFAADAVRLTEIATERKIEELTRQYEEAVAAKNDERVASLESELKEVGKLRRQLQEVSIERDALQTQLESAIIIGHPPRGDNAVGIQTGLIFLIRAGGKYAAVQAVEHRVVSSPSKPGGAWTSEPGGSRNFVRYVWWYQPDGSGILSNENAEFGSGIAHEGDYLLRTPYLRIGPLELQWSAGGTHSGWVYFRRSGEPGEEYEFAHTREIDIANINAAEVNIWYRAS